MTQDNVFFAWQHRVLGWLLGWGAGSIVIGASLARDQQPLVRQIGLQAVSWGVVDAALALAGRRQARAQLHAGAARDKQHVAREAKRFQLITGINALLDVGYIVGGSWLVQSGEHGSSRQGVGVGIVVQGLWLCVYDVYLTLRAQRWRDAEEHVV